MEPIVFPCKVVCNLSVRASVICRRARSVSGVGLKVAEVGPLLPLGAAGRPMDRHQYHVLGKICRVGGQTTAKSWKCAGYSVRAFAIQFQGCLELSVKEDREGVHPPPPPLPPRASPRSLYHLSPHFGVLSGSSGRWSVTHAHLLISTACQHSHSIGKIFGKLSVEFVRQRSSPRFFSYTYLVHTVFSA